MLDRISGFFRKIIQGLFSTSAAGIYLLLFAIAIGVATFIENDFGTSAAQKVIYKTKWFELLLLLFAGSIGFNVLRFRMIQRKKWGTLTFHLSVLVILIGAAITRYSGFEGMIHIRESSSSNSFLSAENYLNFEVAKNGSVYQFHEPVLFASLGSNRFNETYQLGTDLLQVKLDKFIPNPTQKLIYDENGAAYLKLVFGSAQGRKEYFLKEGSRERIGGQIFNFSHKVMPGAVNFKYTQDSLLIHLPAVYDYSVMATQETGRTSSGVYEVLRLRALYSSGRNQFVVGEFSPSANIDLISDAVKMKNESTAALLLNVSLNSIARQCIVIGQKGVEGSPQKMFFENTTISISYGPKRVQLPFSIYLKDFQMDKYPGTNNASGYASSVKLIDQNEKLEKNFRIYMNNILNYKGYRFFQSSFDQDELGTYLSVNHDWWGTWVSYLGYFLLTLGMVITLFSRNSRFQQLSRQLKRERSRVLSLIFVFFSFFGVHSASDMTAASSISIEHARQFSTVVMQDLQGRMKPFHTLSREILRKLSRKETINGLIAEQVILGMYHDNKKWYHIPLIKNSKSEKLVQILGSSKKLLRYDQFFHQNGQYKLRSEVRKAFAMAGADRGTYEKELLKLDERINIISMVFSGRLLRMIPIPGDQNNRWLSEPELQHVKSEKENYPAFMNNFYNAYHFAVMQANVDGDWSKVDDLTQELKEFQKKFGQVVFPGKNKIKAEILLNKMDVFDRLALFYAILGIVFVILLFVSVFRTSWNLHSIFQVFVVVSILLFLFHTLGLGIRWYVSGRAPWSNGYESMIYIAWTSVLAGLIFARKAIGGMAATMILSSTILLVAMLSYLDPEITPLVPVLNSYWLTIHVSLEAGSYGFLLLGAIIAFLNLSLMAVSNQKSSLHVESKVKELSRISEMTLIGGLFMISIGTYLGGVWANESWGRYWGWDAKETWALVTILVYSFILHMRFIPGLRGFLAYNVASLFGWASVIMTYYGVNYYLSGLHSYAAGDPAPIPNWVYIVVAGCIVICLLAWYKKQSIGLFGKSRDFQATA